MKELYSCILISIMLIICTAELSSDEALAYPYQEGNVDRRNADGCVKFAYQRQLYALYPAHTGNILQDHDSAEIPLKSESSTTNRNPEKSKHILPTTSSAILKDVLFSLKSSSKSSLNNSKISSRLVHNIEFFHGSESFGRYNDKRFVFYHLAYINNPRNTLSVYEPLIDGTCQNGSFHPATVIESGLSRKCKLATNAGLFNTKTGACYGNIVSNGRLVQDSGGIRNAHFGITKQNQLFFGYLSEIDLVADDFQQLVGGVIWVLRDGEMYVDKSIQSECRDTEETGTLYTFASVISARTLVAHDKYGRVMILQVEGKTYNNAGVSLYEAAEILKKHGAVNAINLDGGGSSTMILNDTLLSYPSDPCPDNENVHCARNVTTILCVHDPPCPSPDCQGHGSCDQGVCHCHGAWTGPSCDRLECPSDCRYHGTCTEDGCVCQTGYHGDDCSMPCAAGWHGNQCSLRCICENNATCDGVTGTCLCQPGFSGKLCEQRCMWGTYGENCSQSCQCDDECQCDPVTGYCNYTYLHTDLVQAGPCLLKKLEQQKFLEVDMSKDYRNTVIALTLISVIAFLSCLLNVVLICKCCRQKKTARKKKRVRAKPISKEQVVLLQSQRWSSFTTSSSSDDETSFMLKNSGQS